MPMIPFGENQPCLDISYGGYTSAGKKPHNEDAFAARQGSKGIRRYKGAVVCIADGVSCSDQAELASTTAVTTFIEDYYSTPDSWPVKQSAARVLLSLNAWLYHHGQHQNSLRHNSLVTTFSGIVFKSTTAHIFHTGDSRVYRLRAGLLEQLTRDHTSQRGGEKSYLSRALGMDSHLEIDYLQEDLEEGDLFVLTTDGVHEYLNHPALTQHIQNEQFNRSSHTVGKRKDQQVHLEKASQAICANALENGSDDNLSCLMVRINALPVEDIDEVHRKLTQLKIPPIMEVGHSIDGYKVLDVLHSGTRSHIYLVKHPDLSQKMILKAPSPNFAEDPQYLEGFIREQWVGRRINHSAVMKIYARPEQSPFLYHLCEYIEGTTLRQWMLDHPHPPLQEVRTITQGIVTALRALQRQGMIHRDLKPENLILDKAGNIRLIDFGTVKVDSLEEIKSVISDDVPVGSVDYIAPEYLQGEKGLHSSDIFSLGVIVYEMCTGHLPFKPMNSQQATTLSAKHWDYNSAKKHREQLPLWFDLAIKKACEFRPAKRYQALSEFLQDITTPNEQLLAQHQHTPLIERNPLAFWQAVSALLLVLSIIEATLLWGG